MLLIMAKDPTVKTEAGESLVLEGDPDLNPIQINDLAAPPQRLVNG